MEWTFKIRSENVTYTISETEIAVKPMNELFLSNKDEFAATFGEVIETEPFDGGAAAEAESAADREVFRKAGWQFVHPHAEVALMTETGPRTIESGTVHQVILSDTRSRMIATGLATVRFNDEKLSEEEVKNLLAEDGLSIVYRLGFAPNTFEVRLPSGRPLPEIIGMLQAKTERYQYAEPSLLQIIKPREAPRFAPLSEPEIKNEVQWHHIFMRSFDAWKDTVGKGLRVAVIENGMQVSHTDLEESIVGGGFFKKTAVGETQFVRYEKGMPDFPDDSHGTLVLGLVGARLNGSQGCGVAPEAGLIAIACLPDQTGTQATLARAVHYAADPSFEDKLSKPGEGADVISCSLDTQKKLDSNLYDAITFASNQGRAGKGAPIFWAVDNLHTAIEIDKVFSHPEVIAIAGHDREGNKVQPSAFGKRLEYLAPGEDVASTNSFNGFREDNDGTSFATPLAAGVAALVLSLQPEWTAKKVREHLKQSCVPPGSAPDNEVGFGRLSAAIAVAKAKPPDL